jgi:broad-specificity NMP kinase
MRIAIIGSPRAGKTTLANRFGDIFNYPVFHSDDLMHLEWSVASNAVATQIEHYEFGIWEGVAVVRALRKLLWTRTTKPVDFIVVLPRPIMPLSDGQEAMRKGCETIFKSIQPELHKRGVPILMRSMSRGQS